MKRRMVGLSFLLSGIGASWAGLLGDYAPLYLGHTWKYTMVKGDHRSEERVSDYWSPQSVDSSGTARISRFEVRRIGERREFAQGPTATARGELLSLTLLDTISFVSFLDSNGGVHAVDSKFEYDPFGSLHWYDSTLLASPFFKKIDYEGKPAGTYTKGAIMGPGMLFSYQTDIGLINGIYMRRLGSETYSCGISWSGFQEPPPIAINRPEAKAARPWLPSRAGYFASPVFSGHTLDGRVTGYRSPQPRNALTEKPRREAGVFRENLRDSLTAR